MLMLDAPKTTDDVRSELASAAKARRLAMNITQDDLSQRSGVAIATSRRLEAGGGGKPRDRAPGGRDARDAGNL